MSVLVIEHHPVEGIGRLGELLLTAGKVVTTVRVHCGDTIPGSLQGQDALVLMGGPMGVYETDRHPYLRDEINLIRQAIERQIPVLGICLGSQLLAAALGARVRPGPHKEIGWYPVEVSPEAAADPLFQGLTPTFEPLHWHGDVFELPAGAVGLARSAATELQAFRFGGVAYGLLFHLEATSAQVTAMVGSFADELTEAGIDGAAIVEQSHAALRRLDPMATEVLGRWIKLITT